jgi:hypothetical protein
MCWPAVSPINAALSTEIFPRLMSASAYTSLTAAAA